MREGLMPLVSILPRHGQRDQTTGPVGGIRAARSRRRHLKSRDGGRVELPEIQPCECLGHHAHRAVDAFEAPPDEQRGELRAT